MMKIKNEYVAPQLSVVSFATSDVITTSGDGDIENFDNYMNDVFITI